MRVIAVLGAVSSLFCAPALAQREVALLVLVEEGVRADASLVRAAIGLELERPVMGPPGPPVPRIEVRADATALIVRWVPEEGYAIERSVPWPSDDAAVARTAAMLAANLVRDQAADVLATIAICPEPPPESLPQAPPPPLPTPPTHVVLGDPSVPPPPSSDEGEPQLPEPRSDLVGTVTLGLSMGGMSGAPIPLFGGTVEGAIRWRELAVGLSLWLGATDVDLIARTDFGAGGTITTNQIRAHVVPTLAYEPDIGPVRLHFGAGLGLAFFDYTAGLGLEGARAYLRATAGAAYMVHEPIEIVAQGWFATWFEGVSLRDSFLQDYRVYDGGITVGARFTIR